MSIPQQGGGRIESYGDLAAYLEAGCKPKADWRIGTEHEKFGYCKDTQAPLPYDGDRSIRAVLQGLSDRFGWQPLTEGGKLIGLSKEGANISLEPGGALELSGAPLGTIHQTCDEVNDHLREVKDVADEIGVGFIGLGAAPEWLHAEMPDLVPELLYLDCSTDILLRRFSETRRRHPMAKEDRVEAGIQRELALLAPLRERADVLIDTSNLNVHQLRAEVEHWFAPQGQNLLSVAVQSFSYKRGLPRSVDMVFDCRFLSNPYWVPELRTLTGQDQAVQDHIRNDARFSEFEEKVHDIVHWLLPAYRDEGKSHLSVAFGCTGGQHRSVAIAENLAAALAKDGWRVSIRHRELDRKNRKEVSD
ncbi:MAG: RNase adapter RapZ [Pseudomonadota bacterium]